MFVVKVGKKFGMNPRRDQGHAADDVAQWASKRSPAKIGKSVLHVRRNIL